MNGFLKMAVSLFALLALFKIGYDRAANADEERGASMSMPQRAPHAYARALPRSTQTGKSRFLLNGIPAEIDMYATKAPAPEQAAKFASEWSAQGYKTSMQAMGQMQILSAVNEHTKQFQCAIMIPDPANQQTFVIPAQLNLQHPPEPGNLKTATLPGAQTLFHIEAHDLGGYSENLIQVSKSSVPVAMNFYKTQLQQQGWQSGETPKTMYDPNFADQQLFLKGASERWIYASRMEGQNQVMVFSLLNEK